MRKQMHALNSYMHRVDRADGRCVMHIGLWQGILEGMEGERVDGRGDDYAEHSITPVL